MRWVSLLIFVAWIAAASAVTSATFKAAAGECTENGSFSPVEGDCNSFYECSNGELNQFECPAGLCWNQNDGICDWPDKCTCNGDDGGDGDVGGVCSGEPGEYYPVEGNCNAFYQCYDGEPFEFQCPYEFCWDTVRKTCTTPEACSCKVGGDEGNNGDGDEGNNGDGDGDEGNNGDEEDNDDEGSNSDEEGNGGEGSNSDEEGNGDEGSNSDEEENSSEDDGSNDNDKPHHPQRPPHHHHGHPPHHHQGPPHHHQGRPPHRPQGPPQHHQGPHPHRPQGPPQHHQGRPPHRPQGPPQHHQGRPPHRPQGPPQHHQGPPPHLI